MDYPTSNVIDYVESSISNEGRWVSGNLWEAAQKVKPYLTALETIDPKPPHNPTQG